MLEMSEMIARIIETFVELSNILEECALTVVDRVDKINTDVMMLVTELI